MDQIELYDHVQINVQNPEEKLRYEDLTNKSKLILIQAPYDVFLTFILFANHHA